MRRKLTCASAALLQPKTLLPRVQACNSFRKLHIRPAPSSSLQDEEQPVQSSSSLVGTDTPDARFEVLGASDSILSVSLTASQNLFTRRGSLIGLSGRAENARSTLSILAPLRRAFLRIPFLYQKISSTSPITALISTNTPHSSTFTVVALNGTVDWIVAQRKALLAWTGHSLSVRPTVNLSMSIAHWGSSAVTGRGLLALVCRGQVYKVVLEKDEDFIVHPSNVVAYTVVPHKPPSPYRLPSASLRFQVPSLRSLLPDTKFFAVMRESETWTWIARAYFVVRTWYRRTVFGDRLFLRFEGPTTLLLQSRAASPLRDVLSRRDVDEIYGGSADAHALVPPGAAHSAVHRLAATSASASAASAAAASAATPISNSTSGQHDGNKRGGDDQQQHHQPSASSQQQQQPERLHVASVERRAGSGTRSVTFEEARDFSAFVGPRATS